MKTLFLTDLDGTFLDSNAAVSQKSAEIIGSLISQGLLFTVSTARTHATVLEMFKDINLNIPLVLMNGVLIFDPKKKQIVSTHSIDLDSAQKVLRIFEKHGKYPMLYFEEGNRIRIVYKDLTNKYQQDYINHRNESKEKVFEYSDSPAINEKLIYIVTLDPEEELRDIYEEVCKIKGVNCMFYSDNYTGCYFLEIMSCNVSKGTGAQFVKNHIGADKIIVFGDNLNDIPIFEVADECYAVENAHDNLKKISTGVIGKNDDDAVALFIEERMKQELN